MNFGGTPLLSRSTIATGRSLYVLSFAAIMRSFQNIDLSSFAVLGVTFSESQLSSSTIWVLLALWVTHLVHWTGDLVSLGKWNSSLSSKLAQSTFGGGGKMKGRIEFILESFERVLDDEDKIHRKMDIDYIHRALKDFQNSLWWHERAAVFYVVFWSFVFPSLAAALSVYLLCVSNA